MEFKLKYQIILHHGKNLCNQEHSNLIRLDKIHRHPIRYFINLQFFKNQYEILLNLLKNLL